jgi:hypothetical protein
LRGEKDAQDRRQAWLIYVKPVGLGTTKQALVSKLQHHDLIRMVGYRPDHPIIAYHTINFANDR